VCSVWDRERKGSKSKMLNIVRCSLVVTITKQEIYEQEKIYASVTMVFG